MRKSASFYFFKGKPIAPTNRGEESRPVVGRHFICHSGREGGHSGLAGAGLSGTGYIGKKAARQHRWL